MSPAFINEEKEFQERCFKVAQCLDPKDPDFYRHYQEYMDIWFEYLKCKASMEYFYTRALQQERYVLSIRLQLQLESARAD